MKSADFGRTWARYDGTPITLPGTAALLDPTVHIPPNERGYFTNGSSLTFGGIAVDAAP